MSAPDPRPVVRVPKGLIRRDVVSFGRRDGRLKGRMERTWSPEQAAYLVEPERIERDTSIAPGWVFDPEAAYGRRAPLVVEIGTGTGDALLAAAAASPDVDHLGVEVYRPGVSQTLSRAIRAGVTNLRVVEADAAALLATGLPPGGVDEVRIFFPDPWPKARHHKRRLIDAGLLRDVVRVLRPHGVLRMATDWADYAEVMRELGDATPGLRNIHPGEWAPRYDVRPVTRFEKKGLDHGRVVRDLTYERGDDDARG